MEQNPRKAAIKLYSLKELADLYRCDRRTMQRQIDRHLDVIGERIGRFYTPKQVEIIFEVLGHPNEIE